MKNIFGITFEALEEYFKKNNDKKFRAVQIFDFLYKKRNYELDNMSKIQT